MLRLMEGLETAGTESTLLARREGALFGAARKAGLNVQPLGWLKASAEARRCDVVHAHDARSHTMAAVAGIAPLVVSRRVAFPVRSTWKYRRARRYIAVSEFVKSILVEGGVETGKISVIPDGVPLLPLSTGNRIVTPDDGGDPMKGTPLALEAGRQAGITISVSRSLETDLQTAAVLVYLSRSEGLGSGVLLAMSAGVAVIASNVGGLREIVRTGENGILVENNVSAVSEALRKLVNDRELAHRLGEAGRRTVQDRFTVARMVRETADVYRQVVS